MFRFVCTVRFDFVSFRFVPFHLVLCRLVSFGFVWFRPNSVRFARPCFVFLRSVSFRVVPVRPVHLILVSFRSGSVRFISFCFVSNRFGSFVHISVVSSRLDSSPRHHDANTMRTKTGGARRAKRRQADTFRKAGWTSERAATTATTTFKWRHSKHRHQTQAGARALKGLGQRADIRGQEQAANTTEMVAPTQLPVAGKTTGAV